jgi:hypothetical protein
MLGEIEELSLDSACSGRQQQAPSESILVEQMEACLEDQGERGNNFEETLGLSEFDLRMWKAAKSLTDK